MFNGVRWPLVLCVLLAYCLNFAQSQAPSSPVPKESLPEQSGISARELARLRPAVLRDLRKLLARIYNNTPSAADLEDEFQRCHFTPFKLGTLGPAIVVEAEAGHGKSNAAMLDMYVPSQGSYRRIMEAAGFGPEIVPGPGTIPDLVFGWSSGVCHTKYYLYRYERGRYTVEACDQEERGENWDGGSCIVKACEGHLPTFPYSFDSSLEPGDRQPQVRFTANVMLNGRKCSSQPAASHGPAAGGK